MESLCRNQTSFNMDIYKKIEGRGTVREKEIKVSTGRTGRTKDETEVEEVGKKNKKPETAVPRRGLRDLKQYWKAMTYVNKSFE